MAYNEVDFARFKKNELKPGDTFQFACAMCGSCCRNRREAILMTGADIFRAAKALGVSVEEVLPKNFETYVGEDSHVPLYVLAERLDGSCRFLRKGRCLIQQDLPGVTAIGVQEVVERVIPDVKEPAQGKERADGRLVLLNQAPPLVFPRRWMCSKGSSGERRTAWQAKSGVGPRRRGKMPTPQSSSARRRLAMLCPARRRLLDPEDKPFLHVVPDSVQRNLFHRDLKRCARLRPGYYVVPHDCLLLSIGGSARAPIGGATRSSRYPATGATRPTRIGRESSSANSRRKCIPKSVKSRALYSRGRARRRERHAGAPRRWCRRTGRSSGPLWRRSCRDAS